MNPVDQTLFGGPDATPSEAGNCMSACFATLLEMPLADVPHFASIEEAGEWWFAMIRWAAELGYGVVQCLAPVPGAVGMMSGKSPRGDFQHLVVARGDEVIHDPHPSRDGLDGNGVEWWYLVSLESLEAP